MQERWVYGTDIQMGFELRVNNTLGFWNEREVRTQSCAPVIPLILAGSVPFFSKVGGWLCFLG
jgi:hypothetical protein